MLAQFFDDLLPQGGNLFLFTKHDKQHHMARSHSELVALSADFLDVADTYYATASFGDKISPATGSPGRKQDNVLARKCFHLDLDCGPEKMAKHPDTTYATQKDALASLVNLERFLGLTFSHIVSSGVGIHAYIMLSEEVPEAQWMRTAKVFQALLLQEGVRVDGSVTQDSARVLRAPGFLHSDGPRVKLLMRRDVGYTLNEVNAAVVPKLRTPIREDKPARASINDEVLIVEGPPKSIMAIVPKCAAMARVVKARGNVTEPLWRAMLGIVKYTIEGAAAAHALSAGHPEYSKADTQAKFDRWSAGPTTCAEFSKHCRDCAACPHMGTIKSPITLGYMTTKQVEELPEEKQPAATKPPPPTGDMWDGTMPKGFKVVGKGGTNTLIWSMPVERDNENGDSVTVYVDVPVTNDVFWFGQWADAEHTDDTAQTVMHKWDGESVLTYTFDQTLIANQQKFREFLAGKSIISASHKSSIKAMEEYAKAQLNRIKGLAKKPKINTRFGLRILPNGNLIAAQGEYVIYGDGTIHRAMLGAELRGLAPAFTMPLPHNADGEWGADVWASHILPAAKRHSQFMAQHFKKPGLEKLQLAAMLSMASPLMAFVTGEYTGGIELPPTGLTTSLYSRNGGRGKTTLMKAALLAYGKPGAMTRDQNALASTEKARIARLTLMGTTPVGMDEMGANNAKATSDLISAIANGSSRERADIRGGLNLGSTWALTCLIGTNKSQRDMLAVAGAESDAVQYRLIELDVQDLPEFDVDARKTFDAEWSALADCAGALGAVIHREICRRGVANVNQLVMQAVSVAAQKVGADQTSRFQYRALGAAIALQRLLRDTGLDMFDMGALVAEFIKAQSSAQEFMLDNILPSDEIELLAMFLNSQHEYTAVTHNETRRSYTVRAFDTPLGVNPKECRVRHVVSTKRSYVDYEAFKAWFLERGIHVPKVIAAAKAQGVLTQVLGSAHARVSAPYNLRKGMADSTDARVPCVCFDVGRLNRILGLPDEAALPANVVEMQRAQQEPAEEEDTKVANA